MALSLLDEIIGRLDSLPVEERAEIVNAAMQSTSDMIWIPQPGPQTEAYFCEADELFFGGQAGGGKTDLGIGLALTDHHDSLLLRRTSKDADALFFPRIEQIIGNTEGRNMGSASKWDVGDRTMDIGGCQREDDKQKFKGKPHDYIFCCLTLRGHSLSSLRHGTVPRFRDSDAVSSAPGILRQRQKVYGLLNTGHRGWIRNTLILQSQVRFAILLLTEITVRSRFPAKEDISYVIISMTDCRRFLR